MKFTCNKDVLAKAAQIVHRGTKDIELPIMSGILLRTEGEQLILASTDTEEGIECRVPIQCKLKAAPFLDGYYFTEIIRKWRAPTF